MFNNLRETIEAYKKKDPAARGSLYIFLLYPGVHATIYHRYAHKLYLKGHHFLARWLSNRCRRRTGIEIHPGATIGKRFVIDHGMGIVIGETAEIGDDCLIYQEVTLGGTGKDTGKRHPTLGNNVLVGVGAKILGPITIGDGARIAGGAVVLHNVPEDATAVGVPARIVRVAGEKPEYAANLDHSNIKDPVSIELDALRVGMETLEQRITELTFTDGGGI